MIETTKNTTAATADVTLFFQVDLPLYKQKNSTLCKQIQDQYF